MFSIDLMDKERRRRFIAYFDGPPLCGDRQRLIQRTRYTKGRVAQFFDEDQPFGEKAARNLALRLGLKGDAFERDEGGSTAVVSIRPQGASAATSPLHDSLQAVLNAIVAAPAARWPSIRAQFDQAVQQPDKLAEVVAELEALLDRPPGKRVSNGGP